MKLTVRLFAALRERAGRSEIELQDLPAGLDVAGLKRELRRLHPELGDLSRVRCAIGTTYAAEETAIPEGAELALIPPVSGGAPEEDEDLARGVFELVNGPIDALACQRRVEHPSCGACVVFSGLVRNENRGRTVLRLEYEAYEAMTTAEMARIFERCIKALGVLAQGQPENRLRMLCQHRVGRVEIGEPSVVIAVASPHRDAAFRAARFLIDELKANLPIWKKETYPAGEEWIGERS